VVKTICNEIKYHFKMKVLGIMGSPRREGNSSILLDEALRGAEEEGCEVEKFIVSMLNILPCNGDEECFKDGICTINDDMNLIYPKLLTKDVIIISSPIFFYGLPSSLKALIDRCQALWVRKLPISKRKGAFIGVGATHSKDLFDGIGLTIKYFFKAIGVRYVNSLFVRGVEKKQEIKKYPSFLKDAYNLGKMLAK